MHNKGTGTRWIAAAILLPTLAAPAADLRSDWNLRDHIALKEITVQSHRGAGVLMPENSIDAFELAWSLGTVPEGDLRTTSDGVIVAFHDDDFKRILPGASSADQKKGIKDLTWAEVAKLDIGAWKGPQFAGQRVPRMIDVYRILQQHRDRRLYIDIKNVDLAELAREARGAKVAAQLILASTDYGVIRRWKELAPESFTLHWMGGTEAVLAKRIEELRTTNFADITQLQIHVRPGKDGAITPSPEFLLKTGAELRNHGILFQTLPWQSKDPDLFRKLMDLGCASFATDYPDVAMKTIREYYEQRR
jgi:glycerophosphoryl diester phosphodiesterase